MVNGVSVFNEKTLRKAIETSEEERLKKSLIRCDARKIAELTKVCNVLLSEVFAKRLLTEPLLTAFYDNRDAVYSCFDAKFSLNVLEKDVFGLMSCILKP